jgi:PAS domain S-box-containing protein
MFAVESNLPVLDNIVDKMPGGFFIYRADDKEELIYANDVLLEIFGCQNLDEFKNLTGYTFPGIVHPDDLDEVQASIRRQIAIHDKKIDYVEYRIIRKDGTIRWVDDFGRFTHSKNYGDVFYVFLRDITEIHLEREENQRRQKVIEGLSVDFASIYLINLETGTMRPYRLENEIFNALTTELDRKNIVNFTWLDVLPIYVERFVLPEDKELFFKETKIERILEKLDKESSCTLTYRCKGENDKIIYTEMFISRVEEENSTRHIVVGFRDVTENFTQMRRELADKMNIEMALEREKHANEVKSSFLFNISHDIRTPMNAIMGFTELAKIHLENASLLKKYLEKVDEANHHLLSLIDDLLEMSRVDYGRLELKSEPCNLREQINIVLDMFRPFIAQKNIALEENLDLPTNEVFVDSVRFRRVMSNLMSNAVKFTPANGKIKVSALRKQISDSGYARYQFSISDTGVGMSEAFMKKMYDAFEREQTSTKTGYIGAGLGLSITKKLLNIMGGSISVKSKKDEGSTFTVDLPLKLVEHTSTGEIIEESKIPKHFDEHRILLVEDIEMNRLLAETILTESGFLVESVPDGSDAVEIIKSRPVWYYDLVLMDIQMPVMNGYEATRAIRALGREDTNVLPIIALSANAREEDRKMSLESGMNFHVAKPFDIAHLISTIDEYISVSRK